MNAAILAQYSAFLLIVVLLVKPVGSYLARVFSGERTWLDPLMRPLERAVYRLAGVDATAEMDWKRYAGCLVGFGLAGTLLLYAVLRLQPLLHTFDPAFRPGPLAPDLAMNTAISFATTTTWQAHGGPSVRPSASRVLGAHVRIGENPAVCGREREPAPPGGGNEEAVGRVPVKAPRQRVRFHGDLMGDGGGLRRQ